MRMGQEALMTMDANGAALRRRGRGVVLMWAVCAAALAWAAATAPAAAPTGTGDDPAVRELAAEVANHGWIVFAARSAAGDYDLMLCRPDGAQLRNLTNTPDFSEFGARFSPDGTRLLYRRVPRGQQINHDLWGQFGTLVVANADGSNPVEQGRAGEFPWASWGPDGHQWACLYRREGVIRIIDAQTKQVVRELPNSGIFQQLFWSPDGRRLCGTANVAGQDWNILSIELASGRPTLLSRELNCTPDWFHDSQRVIYSNRRPGLADGYGFTMLMQASVDGTQRTLVYAERGRHVYFGCLSPDDKYVIFSLLPQDGGIEAPMALIRMSDTPIIVGGARGYPELEALYPGSKKGPVLRLGNVPEGFEPHWTAADPAAGRAGQDK